MFGMVMMMKEREYVLMREKCIQGESSEILIYRNEIEHGLLAISLYHADNRAPDRLDKTSRWK